MKFPGSCRGFFRNLLIMVRNQSLHKRTSLSPRFRASGVTLSGLAGGESLPLPASKGPAFPFLLVRDGYPTPSAISLIDKAVRSEQGEVHTVDETSIRFLGRSTDR